MFKRPMAIGITPDLARELQNSGMQVTTMKHAYRINGVVDVWFNGRTLYNKSTNTYANYDTKEQLISVALRLAAEMQREEPFKKTAKGRVSYQGFKHQSLLGFAEYSHWQHNDCVSEDHLYFIQHGTCVKIGRSKDPASRMKSLQTGMPEKPVLLLVVKNRGCMERVLHDCFSEWRTRAGSEWFLYNEQIKSFIGWINK